jgi:hypothetical protein
MGVGCEKKRLSIGTPLRLDILFVGLLLLLSIILSSIALESAAALSGRAELGAILQLERSRAISFAARPSRRGSRWTSALPRSDSHLAKVFWVASVLSVLEVPWESHLNYGNDDSCVHVSRNQVSITGIDGYKILFGRNR